MDVVNGSPECRVNWNDVAHAPKNHFTSLALDHDRESPGGRARVDRAVTRIKKDMLFSKAEKMREKGRQQGCHPACRCPINVTMGAMYK